MSQALCVALATQSELGMLGILPTRCLQSGNMEAGRLKTVLSSVKMVTAGSHMGGR